MALVVIVVFAVIRVPRPWHADKRVDWPVIVVLSLLSVPVILSPKNGNEVINPVG